MSQDVKLCECGCGEPAPIATRNEAARGYVSGEPRRYINGHCCRGRRRTDHGTPEERFWAKVDRRGPDECWPWLAFTVKGYGRFSVNGENVAAHRFSYELVNGPLSDVLVIDHLCENPSCVNPAHLEMVPIGVNTLRGHGFAAVNERKTHCVHGHELTAENIYHLRKGGRACRTCRIEAKRRWRERARASA